MARQLLALVRFSMIEVLHKRILLAVALLTLIYLFMLGLGLHYITGTGFDQLAALSFFSMALYLGSLLTSLLAVLLSVGAIAGELESGTAYALLSRPVSRPVILVGKYLGYAVFMALYAALFFLGLWLTVTWQGGVTLTGIGEALGLFVLQPLILLSISFLAGTILSTMGAGTVVFLLYGVSLVGGMIEQIGALMAQAGLKSAPTLVNIGIVSSLVLPVDALYRRVAFSLIDARHDLLGGLNSMSLGPFGAASVPSVWMVVYAILYPIVCLWLATRIFGRKDV